jgi:hypothetical protein
MSDDSPSLIESLYAELRDMGQAAQLRNSFDNAQLVANFEATVTALSSISAQGPFFPSGSRSPLIELARRWERVDDRIANSAHLQALLWRPPAWRVADRPDLDFEFLGREITPMSSVRDGRRVWLTDKSERRLSLDALLVNCADRTPIVAEFKIGDDQNAELALVQALAAAAQLSTPSQLKRLHIEYRDSLGANVPVRLDVYVITYRARERGVRPQLAQRAKSRVRNLVQTGALSRWIRRIVFLEASLTSGTITFAIAPENPDSAG